MVEYDDLGKFTNAVHDVIIFISDMFAEFFYTFFGYWNEITVNHLWAWLAFLPFLLSFGVEIIFSFVLSFRARKLTIFVPWRRSSYAAIRYGKSLDPRSLALPKVINSSVLREKRLSNRYIENKPRLLSFTRQSVLKPAEGMVYSDPINRHVLAKPIDRKSNEIRHFIPRLTFIVRNFHGFKSIQMRWFGVFKSVYGKTFKKK